ncbi:hypothetical protein SAMN05428957_103173 [Oryzisolibacter propanilivorax]|uniref:Uncharacterized protein n=1 Tax=Oryzisolibacter propanilivorax TaxID=1527607 RepID=A0A1G9RCP3_9BURK|nr:hypothetical protein [Oryzisolibacter propanilivorax]SDM20820.1 hypothetical protein SAMN05428957_103173 [Oryzisolibacter propanilivorax]
MDPFVAVAFAATGAWLVNGQQQRRRIALLSQHLAPLQIEQLMQTLTQGYLRAMGEPDGARRQQILDLLAPQEAQLSQQFERLVASFARVPDQEARVSRLAVGLPFATQLLPGQTFDMRQLLALHARGIARAVRNEDGLAPRDRAYAMTAELLLMQHSCHWFCKSRAVASARMVARHQTPHAQLLASVSPGTRVAYRQLTGVH